MEYNTENKTYTESKQEGHKQIIYYRDDEEIIRQEYNILIYSSIPELKGIFNKSDCQNYAVVIYEKLDCHLGAVRRFYKDLRNINMDDKINEYERLKDKYDIIIDDDYLDDMYTYEPIIYYEYNLNSLTNMKQFEIKSRMNQAKNKTIKWTNPTPSYMCDSESESSDDE